MDPWDEISTRALVAMVEESTHEGVLVLEPLQASGRVVDLRVLQANTAIRSTLDDDPRGRRLTELWPSLDAERIERLAAVVADQEPWHSDSEPWPVGPGGALRHVDLRAAPSGGCLVVMVRDVERRRRAEQRLRAEAQALRESEAERRLVVAHLPGAAVLACDLDGTVRSWNDGAAALFALTADAIVGRSLDALLDPPVVPLLQRIAATGSEIGVDATARRGNGTAFSAAVELRVVRGSDDGGRDLVVVLVRDLSRERPPLQDRDRVAADLRLHQRLEGLGAIAGGVAHDFGNLLTVILSACDLAEESEERGGASEAIAEVRVAAERGAGLVRRLLTFAQQEPTDPEQLHVAPAIAELQPLLERTLPPGIDLDVVLGPDLPALLVDRPSLDQTLLNLVVNARDAMPGGGHITLECERIVAGADDVAEAVTSRLGEHVRIRVADEGTGMAPAVATRAFEPFFTTKPGRTGSGMGLATVYGAVRRAGGTVNLDTGPTGTVVTLHLPAYDNGAAASTSTPASDPASER